MRNRALFTCILVVLLMAGSLGNSFAQEIRAAVAAKYAEAEQAQIEAARADINDFIEYCAGLTQAPHHRRLQAVWKDHTDTVCLFPIEHGKTVQTIWAMIWHMGTYPDRALAYVSSGERPARKVIRTVRRIISTNEKLHAVFPDLVPELEPDGKTKTSWGSLELRIKGASAEDKDPTLAGYGYDGQISGSRLWGVWIDNVCNKKNTNSPNNRENVLESIENDIHSRILEGGFCHITDTSWYDDDPPHVLGARSEWHFVVEDAEKGDIEGETLWPAQWSWERLHKKLGIIHKLAYDRTLRNITTSMSDGTFKEEAFKKCLNKSKWYDSISWANAGSEPVRVVTALDLGIGRTVRHDETVLVTAVRVGHQYQLLNIRPFRISGTDIVREIIRVYRDFHIGADYSEIMVESNQAQRYIVDTCEDVEVMQALGADLDVMSNIYVSPFMTTAWNKRDLEFGVQSVANDLEMGRWLLPKHPEVTKLWDDMRTWSPEAHTGDRLMSMWICREGLRLAEDQSGLSAGTREAYSV